MIIKGKDKNHEHAGVGGELEAGAVARWLYSPTHSHMYTTVSQSRIIMDTRPFPNKVVSSSWSLPDNA